MPGVKDRLPATSLPKVSLPKVVVFDLDGTLVDSVPDIEAALNWLLARLGRRQVARDEVAGMVGDGVPKLVERGLRDAGCLLAVCTNKPAGATAEILGALDLAPFFAAVAGGDTVPGVRKPDPRHLMHVLDQLGAAPGDAVMVGDSHNDVNVAKAAGVATVAVTFGYAHGPVEDLGADLLIDHFDDLVPALGRLTG